VLVASTSEVYGDHREEVELEEDARRMYGPTTQRRWAYADSKAMDEFLALAHHQEHDLDCVIVRLFNTVGPRQSGEYGMVIPRFVERALANAPIEIFGDGEQTRCFCHVDDTVRALVALMDSPNTSGEIYNVGSPNRIRIIDLAERIKQALGSSSELEFVPFDQVYGQGIEDMLHRIPSIAKVGAAVGWKPERSLDDILADVIEDKRSAGAPELSGLQ
jgi:UDP-glucose 4-epimerase